MTGVTETSQVDAVTAESKKWRRGKPKADDICRKCGGKGHWARVCPSESGRVRQKKGPTESTTVNCTCIQAANVASCYHLQGQLEALEVLCLMDPGSQVSLINADLVDTSSLQIESTPVKPIAINQQPILIKGSVTCQVRLGPLQTRWQFLVVKGIASAVVIGGRQITIIVPKHWSINWHNDIHSCQVGSEANDCAGSGVEIWVNVCMYVCLYVYL